MSDGSDPLDDVLASARWPEISAAGEARLRATYGRTGSRGVWWKASAAAVLVVGLSGWMLMRGERRSVEVVKVSRPEVAVVEVRMAGREATPVEVAVVMTAMRERGVKRAPVKVAEDPVVVADACIAAIVKKEGVGGALARLKAAGGERGAVVEVLFVRLGDSRVEVRMAAARALGYVDGPVVTERLAGMVRANRNRREALVALVQSEGPEAREYVRRAMRSDEISPAVRSVVAQVKSF